MVTLTEENTAATVNKTANADGPTGPPEVAGVLIFVVIYVVGFTEYDKKVLLF